jgi:hypothetical protein
MRAALFLRFFGGSDGAAFMQGAGALPGGVEFGLRDLKFFCEKLQVGKFGRRQVG